MTNRSFALFQVSSVISACWKFPNMAEIYSHTQTYTRFRFRFTFNFIRFTGGNFWGGIFFASIRPLRGKYRNSGVDFFFSKHLSPLLIFPAHCVFTFSGNMLFTNIQYDPIVDCQRTPKGGTCCWMELICTWLICLQILKHKVTSWNLFTRAFSTSMQMRPLEEKIKNHWYEQRVINKFERCIRQRAI